MTRPMAFSVVNGGFVSQKEVIHWTFKQKNKKRRKKTPKK